MNHGAKEIYLNGMTADQLSEMIREALRDKHCIPYIRKPAQSISLGTKPPTS